MLARNMGVKCLAQCVQATAVFTRHKPACDPWHHWIHNTTAHTYTHAWTAVKQLAICSVL